MANIPQEALYGKIGTVTVNIQFFIFYFFVKIMDNLRVSNNCDCQQQCKVCGFLICVSCVGFVLVTQF